MQNNVQTIETVQNQPEEAGDSRCPDAASLEEHMLQCADYTYIYRRQAVLEAAEDEEKFRGAFKVFQKAAFKLSRHARGLHRYSEDSNLRVFAIDVLERVRTDVSGFVLIAQAFEEKHVDAKDFDKAMPVADLKLDGIELFNRIGTTLNQIRNGVDAELAIQQQHAAAIERVAPRVRHTFKETKVHSFSPIYTWPIPLPPPDEPLPDYPEAFHRYLFLPPEDMERYPNNTFKVPEGYRDESGEDLTHLWNVDWERGGLVTSGPTDEESDHGRVRWYCWAREYPGKPMPPDCAEYFLRRLTKDLELRKNTVP